MKKSITLDQDIYFKLKDALTELNCAVEIEHINTNYSLYNEGYISFILTDIEIEITDIKIAEIMEKTKPYYVEGDCRKSDKYYLRLGWLYDFFGKLMNTPDSKEFIYLKNELIDRKD